MKPILVHVHLFYPEMWAELKAHLANLPKNRPFRLFVTLVQHYPEIEADIMAFAPEAQIILTENRGFDVGPFVQVLNSVCLDDYSYCIKLHSKRDMPAGSGVGCSNLEGPIWREYLLSFLKPGNIDRVLRAFDTDPKLGMTGHFRLVFYKCLHDCVYDQSAELLRKVGLPVTNFAYIIGTMFMCRAELLKPIQQMGFTMQDFDPPNRHQPFALAYTLEGLLGWVITAQGYELRDCYTSFPALRRVVGDVLHVLADFFYKDKTTATGRRIIKVCRVPVYISRQK